VESVFERGNHVFRSVHELNVWLRLEVVKRRWVKAGSVFCTATVVILAFLYQLYRFRAVFLEGKQLIWFSAR
jgi:hypothetical protein